MSDVNTNLNLISLLLYSVSVDYVFDGQPSFDDAHQYIKLM